MNEWTYSNEPKFDFIKLPDGTIINVAYVRSVKHEEHPTRNCMNGDPVWETIIDTGAIHKFDDGNGLSDGKIYAWFAERAVEVV